MNVLIRFLKPYKGLVALTLAVMLVDCTGTLLVPTMLANMVNEGITSGNMQKILQNGLLMLGATAMASGGAVLGCYLAARLAAVVARDLRCAIYEKSLALAASDFEEFGTGSMITRTLGDINVVQQSIIMTCQMVLPVPFLAVVGIALAFRIDASMGATLLVVVAVVLLIAVLTIRAASPIFMRLQGFIDRMNVVLRESIIGVRVVRAFNKERHEEERLDAVFSDYAGSAIKVNYLFAGLDCSSFFIVNTTEALILWLGGNRVGAYAMNIASISAVLEYAMIILFFIMMAQMVILTLPRAWACLERAGEVLAVEPAIVDGDVRLGESAANGVAGADERSAAGATGEPVANGEAVVAVDAVAAAGNEGEAAVNAAPALAVNPAVPVAEFDHAAFRFDDASEDALRDLSFTCERGKTTAIIGSTGSGKSTVTKLLLRFHDVTAGELRFCGVDVRNLAQSELRRRIAYVPQKAWLFSGTVASNLRYGNEDATEEQMLHALEVAQSQFVLVLPDSLESHVAQGGTNFSGGQRQRLAIARALMKQADLYIFDDSFSALDFKTDAALRAALASETREAATLIIAQRVSTILHADCIVVLKDGAIAGKGTHSELMEGCEAYRAIAESQMRGGVERE